jgi:predicted permease
VHGVRLGLDVDRLVNATIDLRSVGIDSTAADDYFERAREATSRLPGVASVTLADAAPFGDWSIGIDVSVPGRDSLPASKESPLQSFVGSNYFSTVGTRILSGRSFTDADTRLGAAPVIVISESVARWLWPGQSAIGRCIRIGDKKEPCSDVIGIAETAHRGNIVQEGAAMHIYRPLAPGKGDARARVMVVRPTGNEPDALIEPVRRAMQSVVPGVPFAYVRPMQTVLDSEMRPWQLGATMFAAFGLIALVLSSLGLYSMVAYTVAQRMHEMGVRVALGAQDRDIRGLVLAQGLRVAALGVAAGTIIALFTGKFLAPLLYQTSPRDPVVFVAVITLLLTVATLASLVPARRATRADPLVALKAE